MKKKKKRKTAKKAPHVYADVETSRTRELKYCNTCGEGFHGRASFCPGCIGEERRLRRGL